MNLPEFSIEGSTAIVTGASRGIGRSIALVLAEAGADVGIAARSEAPLHEVAAQVRDLGRKCVAVPTDITKEEDVARLVSSVIDGLGRVDILVNNAGIAIVKPMVPLPGFKPAGAAELPGFFEPTSVAEWDQVMDTNLKGAFLCMRAVGPHMIERGSGKVVTIASVNAVKAARYRFTYDVSKAGLAQLTRSMAVEWARHGINVNAVGAGWVQTELNELLMSDERQRKRLLSEIPLRRFASEREVALLVVYLASPASDFLTGQTVFLDGGSLA
ncbi:MAG: SDR family oxidoreductase [Chloroflexi bacterium]|nr:SDR family oxidoreductase [Chloroflexota bacterium]